MQFADPVSLGIHAAATLFFAVGPPWHAERIRLHMTEMDRPRQAIHADGPPRTGP